MTFMVLFTIFINKFAFLYVKLNSKEICERISFNSFLLRFKTNYLEKMRGYPNFSLWIPIALAKIYSVRGVLTWRKKFVFSPHHLNVLKKWIFKTQEE